MENLNFDELPLNARIDLNTLRDYLLSVFRENSDLIDMDETTDYYKYWDISKKFYFNIRRLKFNVQTKKNEYTVTFNPMGPSHIGPNTITTDHENATKTFTRWIDNVRKLKDAKDQYYNPFKKFYDKEFKDYFVNNDEDADTAPFDEKRRELIYLFLEHAKNQIKNSQEITEEKKAELIEETAYLQKDSSRLTKKRFTERLSRFAMDMQGASIMLFHDVFDVLKKEAIKAVLIVGVEHLPEAIRYLQSLLPGHH